MTIIDYACLIFVGLLAVLMVVAIVDEIWSAGPVGSLLMFAVWGAVFLGGLVVYCVIAFLGSIIPDEAKLWGIALFWLCAICYGCSKLVNAIRDDLSNRSSSRQEREREAYERGGSMEIVKNGSLPLLLRLLLIVLFPVLIVLIFIGISLLGA